MASNPLAQELYLRGRYLLRRGWFDVSREGVQMLREAHSLAPDDTRIAGTYALAVARVLTGGAEYESATKGARELAERTLELDPQQSEARVALGFIHLNDAEGAAAAQQLKKALAIAPNSVEALDGIGRLYVEMGRVEQGNAMLWRALAIDPSMAQARQSIARAHALHHDYETADEVLGPIPDQPGELLPYFLMKCRFALWRRQTSFSEELERFVTNVPSTAAEKRSLEGLRYVVKSRTLPAEMRAELEASLPTDSRFAPRRSAFHGQIRVELQMSVGDIAEAMTDLRHCDSNGLLDLMWLERCPALDEVRSLPEFITIHESTQARVERVARALD
jgi:serine/threonine-protein kinase